MKSQIVLIRCQDSSAKVHCCFTETVPLHCLFSSKTRKVINGCLFYFIRPIHFLCIGNLHVNLKTPVFPVGSWTTGENGNVPTNLLTPLGRKRPWRLTKFLANSNWGPKGKYLLESQVNYIPPSPCFTCFFGVQLACCYCELIFCHGLRILLITSSNCLGLNLRGSLAIKLIQDFGA